MNYAQGNQTKAAEILGLNRNTLRKKLELYNLNF
jgi:Fis family transcriptional regulator